MRKTFLIIGLIIILTTPCINITFGWFMDAYAAEKAKKPSSKLAPAPSSKTVTTPVPDAAKQKDIISRDMFDLEPFPFLIKHHENAHVAFSQTGQYLAIGGDGTISIIEMTSMKELVLLKDKKGGVIKAIAFSEDDRYMATGGLGEHVIVFDTSKWQEVADLPLKHNLTSLAFSSDGRFIATGCEDKSTSVFQVGTWNKIVSLQDSGLVSSVMFSPDNRYLVVGSYDQKVNIYESGHWQNVASLPTAGRVQVNNIRFSNDNRYLIVGMTSDSTEVYEVGSWRRLFNLEYGQAFYAVNVSPDGHMLTTVSYSNERTNIYDIESWDKIISYDAMGVAFNKAWLIAKKKDITDRIFLFDVSSLSFYFLREDFRKLGYKQQSDVLIIDNQNNEKAFFEKNKIIISERDSALKQLGATQKDEFETATEYKNRLSNREIKTKEVNQSFEEKRISLRRERANKRVQLVEHYEKELDKLLLASRKPINNLKPAVGTFIPESETFPITIASSGIETLNDTIKVPRTNARSFKGNIDKYQVSGETQLDRTGKKKLVNVVISNSETGEVYYLARPTTTQGQQIAALPPNLSASVKFEEPSGTKALNAEETGKLVIKIKNDGKGSAYQVIVRPIPTAPISDLSYEAEKVIPEIGPGTEQDVIFPLKAGLDLPTKQVQFNVGFEEKNGLPPNPVKISFQTRAVLKPDLQLVDYAIDNAAKDGIIKPEEVVKMTFKVQNKGQGTGRNVVAKVALGNNVFPALNMPLEHGLGELKPNAVKEFTIAFYANQRVRDKLPLKVDLVEDRKRFNAEKQYALSMGVKEKTVFEAVVSAKDLQAVQITDLEASSDLEQDIPSTGVINKNAVAVVIGNYDYKKVQKVSFARRDAVVMKEYLVKTFGYDPGNIIFLPDATLSDMLNALGSAGAAKRSKLSSYLRPGSEIFVYYTGHGAPGLQDKKGYLVPIDADPNNIETTGYSLETLYRNLESLNASKLTVVIDACFSGDSQAGMLFKDASPIMVQAKSDKLNTGTVITSSSGDQISSWYPEKKHSLFTYFFLKGIKDKAARKEPVTIQNLKVYVADEVDRMSRRLYNRIQTPGFEGNLEERLIE